MLNDYWVYSRLFAQSKYNARFRKSFSCIFVFLWYTLRVLVEIRVCVLSSSCLYDCKSAAYWWRDRDFKIITDVVKAYVTKWDKTNLLIGLGWISQCVMLVLVECTNGTITEFNKPIPSQTAVIQSLADLHGMLTVSPTGRASNKFTILCNHQYIMCVIKELGDTYR